MPLITTSLIEARTATVGSGSIGAYKDTAGTLAATLQGDLVKFWSPLAAGNTLGAATTSDAGSTNFLQLNDFAPGVHGIRSTGSGHDALVTTTQLAALGDYDLFLALKILTYNGANSRIVDYNFAAGFFVGQNTANTLGGCIKGGAFTFVTAADGSPHVLHISRIGTTLLVEVDGHAVTSGPITCSGVATSINPYSFFATNVNGSPTIVSLGAHLIHNQSGGLILSDVDAQFAYLKSTYGVSTGWGRGSAGGLSPLSGVR